MSISPELNLMFHTSIHNPNPKDIRRMKQLIKTGIDWNTFVSLVSKHRLFGPVHKTIQAFLRNDVPKKIRHLIHSSYKANVKKSLKNTAEAIRISSSFKTHNIDHIFLKGVCLSHQLYGNVGFRHAGDIDLIIPDKYVEDAMTIFEDLGYRQTQCQAYLTGERLNTFKKISHHVNYTHPESGVSVELHWRFSNANDVLPISLDKALKKRTYIQINNHKLPVLCDYHSLMFLCLHGSKHAWKRWFWLKDIHDFFFFVTHLNKNHFFNDIIQNSLTRPVAEAFYLMDRIYGVTIPDHLSGELESSTYYQKSFDRIFYLYQSTNTFKSLALFYYHQIFIIKGVRNCLFHIKKIVLTKRYKKRFYPDHKSNLFKALKQNFFPLSD